MEERCVQDSSSGEQVLNIKALNLPPTRTYNSSLEDSENQKARARSKGRKRRLSDTSFCQDPNNSSKRGASNVSPNNTSGFVSESSDNQERRDNLRERNGRIKKVPTPDNVEGVPEVKVKAPNNSSKITSNTVHEEEKDNKGRKSCPRRRKRQLSQVAHLCTYEDEPKTKLKVKTPDNSVKISSNVILGDQQDQGDDKNCLGVCERERQTSRAAYLDENKDALDSESEDLDEILKSGLSSVFRDIDGSNSESSDDGDIDFNSPDSYMKYLKTREKKHKIKCYSQKFTFNVFKMRYILVNKLIEWHYGYYFSPKTLHFAVKILDIFFHCVDGELVKKEDLDSYASAVLYIASKYEDTPNEVGLFMDYLNENPKRRLEILRAESHILDVIGYNSLRTSYGYEFLSHYLEFMGSDEDVVSATEFILEVSLMFLNFSVIDGSKVAAACLLWAIRIKNLTDKEAELPRYTGYEVSNIEPMMYLLNSLISGRSKRALEGTSVFVKYSTQSYHSSALLEPLPDMWNDDMKKLVV